MNTGAQDWTMRDATREILVLTKNDEEPTFFTPVGNEDGHTQKGHHLAADAR
jgi:hypothetical protein